MFALIDTAQGVVPVADAVWEVVLLRLFQHLLRFIERDVEPGIFHIILDKLASLCEIVVFQQIVFPGEILYYIN